MAEARDEDMGTSALQTPPPRCGSRKDQREAKDERAAEQTGRIARLATTAARAFLCLGRVRRRAAVWRSVRARRLRDHLEHTAGKSDLRHVGRNDRARE